jgi:hypothetical protein
MDNRKSMVVLAIKGGIHFLDVKLLNGPLGNIVKYPVLRVLDGGLIVWLHRKNGSIWEDMLLPFLLTWLSVVVVGAVLHDLFNRNKRGDELF